MREPPAMDPHDGRARWSSGPPDLGMQGLAVDLGEHDPLIRPMRRRLWGTRLAEQVVAGAVTRGELEELRAHERRADEDDRRNDRDHRRQPLPIDPERDEREHEGSRSAEHDPGQVRVQEPPEAGQRSELGQVGPDDGRGRKEQHHEGGGDENRPEDDVRSEAVGALVRGRHVRTGDGTIAGSVGRTRWNRVAMR